MPTSGGLSRVNDSSNENIASTMDEEKHINAIVLGISKLDTVDKDGGIESTSMPKESLILTPKRKLFVSPKSMEGLATNVTKFRRDQGSSPTLREPVYPYIATSVVGGECGVGREGGAIKRTERQKRDEIGGAKGKKTKATLAAPNAQMCIKSALRKGEVRDCR